MITYIKVNGFRSLRDFSLSFKPGINVLIGPNGSGKSNIIQYLQFLSDLADAPLSEAVSKVGGAGFLFQKFGKGTYKADLRSTIVGQVEYYRRENHEVPKIVEYHYSFHIKLTEKRDKIYFSDQLLGIRIKDRKSPQKILLDTEQWDLLVKMHTDADGMPQITIPRANKETLNFNGMLGRKQTTRELKKVLINEFERMSMNNRVLFSPYYYPSPYLSLVYQSISDSVLLNVDPSAVKRPEDGATPPGINSDGSGLAATLYYLKQGGAFLPRKAFIPYFYPDDNSRPKEDTFHRVQQFLQLVNSAVDSMEVDNNPFDNRLMVSINIKDVGTITSLPISAMSDGTVKWLSLVTAILTNNSRIYLEEPENFIHPRMQREIVELLRNRHDEERIPTFTLLTSHSETLINSTDPSELIVVTMKNGKTRARRPINLNRLRKEISDSGFGMGFYYLSGALD